MPNKTESEWVFVVFGSGWFESRFRSGRFRLFFSVDEFDDSSLSRLFVKKVQMLEYFMFVGFLIHINK